MAINELIQTYPHIAIIFFALIVTLVITVVNYFMIDKERMKEIKEKQKQLRAEMKNHKGNPEKMMEINKQMMEDMPEQLKMSFKPMLVTMIPILIMFAWIRSTFATTAIAGTWFWWYIGSSIIFSITVRKLFGLQ